MIVVPEERIRDFKARGWWGEETLDDLFRRHVAAMPDAESVVDPINREAIMGGAPARLTWAQVEDRVARYVAVLHATGVGRDDVVAVQLPNVIELGLIYLACIRLGAIVTPAPVQYREHELAYILRKTDAKAVVTAARIGKHAHAEMMLAVQTGAAALNIVLVVGGDAPDGSIDLDARAARLDEAEIEAGRAAARAANICADDIVTICWTSGTEAEPKGVPRSHNEWIIMGAGVTDAADLKPGAVLLNPFPMVNMAGISTSFVSWLLLGGVLVQHQPFDLQIFLQQVRDEKIDYTVAPPAILNLLLQNEALLEGVDFGRLRAIGSSTRNPASRSSTISAPTKVPPSPAPRRTCPTPPNAPSCFRVWARALNGRPCCTTASSPVWSIPRPSRRSPSRAFPASCGSRVPRSSPAIGARPKSTSAPLTATAGSAPATCSNWLATGCSSTASSGA